MDPVFALIGAAWLAIAVMLLGGLANRLRTIGWRRPPLPFLGMLERYGLSFAQVEQVASLGEISHAVKRCDGCDSRFACGVREVACPNAPLFRRALGQKESFS